MKTCDKPEWRHCEWSLPLWDEPGFTVECLAKDEPCPFEEEEDGHTALEIQA